MAEWHAYGGSNAGTKYSSLTQINARNVKCLGLVWRWRSADAPILEQHPEIRTWKFEATPIMVGAVLYTPFRCVESSAPIHGLRNPWMSSELLMFGRPYRGFPLITGSLLFIAQEGRTVSEQGRDNGSDGTFADADPSIQAFDKSTGQLVAQVALPSNATGAPMTYFYRGKQYIVVALGGGNLPAELMALSLR